MVNPKAVLGSVLGRFLFKPATVARVEAPSPRFRRIALHGPALAGASWVPGDKLQVFLPDVGTRAYTPLEWDRAQGATTLLVYLHGDSPGSTWAGSLRGGEAVQLFGPRRSLGARGTGPVVLFGDETSLGLAAALAAHAPPGALAAVLEVDAPEEVATVLGALGLTATLVARTPADAHLATLQRHLHDALAARPGAELLMSGRAPAIQALRARLRRESAARPSATKAYWSPGKAGLD